MIGAKVDLEDLRDDAAVPRSNGELVFQQPWESLLFGLVIGLCESDVLGWDEFREALIEEIADWSADPVGEWSYYTCWLNALQTVLTRRGLLELTAIDAMAAGIEAEFHHDDQEHGHPH